MEDQTRKHWKECDYIRWASTKPDTNSSFNMSNSTIWCHTIHFLLQSWFELFKGMTSEELTEANCHARLSCSEWLLNDVIFYSFSDEKLSRCHISYKMTDCMRLLQQRIKTSEHSAFFAQERRSAVRLLMTTDGLSKFSFAILIFIDPGVKVDGASQCELLLSQQLLPVMG